MKMNTTEECNEEYDNQNLLPSIIRSLSFEFSQNKVANCKKRKASPPIHHIFNLLIISTMSDNEGMEETMSFNSNR